MKDQSSTQTIGLIDADARRTVMFWTATNLVWVRDVGAAVAGISYAVSISVQLISVLDTLAVVQNVLQAC